MVDVVVEVALGFEVVVVVWRVVVVKGTGFTAKFVPVITVTGSLSVGSYARIVWPEKRCQSVWAAPMTLRSMEL